jgi:DNA-binding GntR family transcriptional regulator
LKRAILRGEYPEGAFLSEAEVGRRFRIGRTPFREACNRLHNEQLLEAVPRRGFLVPEMSFHTVRDLLETRLILEGVIAELAAKRAAEPEIADFQRLYRIALQHARAKAGMDEQVHANTEFHLHIASMAHNRELESLLRSVLERSTRLFYMIVRSSPALDRDAQDLLKPIVEAIRGKDPAAAHKAVIRDITHGQMNVLGRDLWEKPR